MAVADAITQLQSCIYKDLPKHSKVFNKDTLNYHLWIYLNPEDVRDAYFIRAEEIGVNADNSTIFPDTFVRESQCWIRVNTSCINQSVGKHTLRFYFVDRYTDTDFSLYASYYIQDDNPDKPYVYMPQEDKEDKKPPHIRPESGFTEYTGT